MKKEIITITGGPGTGTSSNARKVANLLGYTYFSSGDLFREIAERRNVLVDELNHIAETDPTVDDEMDTALRDLGRGSHVVIDSRIAFHWIPDSFKVVLVVDPHVAAERIFKQIREDGRKSQNASSVEEVRSSNELRKTSEYKRYREKHGIDMADLSVFDLVINNGKQPKDVTVQQILDAYREWNQQI